ncbi:hypothetical protein [Metabacillus sp. RGM 3146]|uniref:hypothetical protein n=1 Tax=Metabacillus sp. RGM 3146 TaxID=3401092 RepID=UPI003B9C6229
MNLVIEDWKGKKDWSKLAHYSFFEYISFTVAVTGIAISIGLAVLAIVNLLIEYKNRAKNLG